MEKAILAADPPQYDVSTYPGTICQSYRAGWAGWDKIAEQTIEVYRKALAQGAGSGEQEAGRKKAQSSKLKER